MKYSQAFVQGQFICIDVLNPHTGRSSILGETLEQIQRRYPGAELVDLAAWIEAKDRALCSDPVEITREQFEDALDTLPPQNWQRAALAESFEFMEHTSGRVTTIYCRTGRRFWEFQGVAGMTLDEIIRRVAAVAKPQVCSEPKL